MIEVLRNEHPANVVLTTGDLAERAIHQARCEGYTMALQYLASLGVHSPEMVTVESTYETDENFART